MSSGIHLIERAIGHGGRRALVAPEGTFTYTELLDRSRRAAEVFLDGASDLSEQRVVFLCPPGARYVITQWGIWRAGGVAVPLAPSQAPAEWEYIVSDTRASLVVVPAESEDAMAPIARRYGARVLFMSENGPDGGLSGGSPLPHVRRARRAMILYTSGTTSRPKGVVTTHEMIEAQVTTLVEAWGWSPEDHALHVLPLNHVHGIVNVLTSALWTGATCEVQPGLDPVRVWSRLASGDVSVFMAVPTIYVRLIASWQQASPAEQRAWSEGAARLRLMVSGSAALPVPVLDRWRGITGHILLERYGMTEIGMALSNPLEGERRPGFVGTPLPGVEVRLVDEEGRAVDAGEPGEIEVGGPSVFFEYWSQPEATRAAFRDGWFRTGDIAVLEEGMYRILGRRSVDIIKSGGHKLSALEIEDVLCAHPDIADCAVVGIEDDEWGERVAAAIVLAGGRTTLDLADLRTWARARLASGKLPSRMLVVTDLPRNQMGKVTKAQVRRLFT